MKKGLIIGVILFAVTLCVSPITHAQGTTCLSNLGGEIGFKEVTSDYWLAIGFKTGTNAGGYALNSVQLQMSYGSSNAGGFAVALYTSTTTGPFRAPVNDLGSLVGSDNPSTPALYTYTASGLALAASTGYFLLLTAATPSATGSYALDVGGSISSIDGWNTVLDYHSTNDGASWLYDGGGDEFSINATAIPEPSAWSLLLLGGGAFLCVRARKPPAAAAGPKSL